MGGIVLRKVFCVLLTVFLVLTLACCGDANSGDSSPAFNEVKDNDTGKTVSLGTDKSIFDEMFGKPESGSGADSYEYLSGALTVTYKDNLAVDIEVSGKSNRFSFYNFDFGKDIKDIEGGYEKFDDVSGYTFYSKDFDKNGKEATSPSDTYVTATLMVRDGDLGTTYKDGEYISYDIQVNAFTLPASQRATSTQP